MDKKELINRLESIVKGGMKKVDIEKSAGMSKNSLASWMKEDGKRMPELWRGRLEEWLFKSGHAIRLQKGAIKIPSDMVPGYEKITDEHISVHVPKDKRGYPVDQHYQPKINHYTLDEHPMYQTGAQSAVVYHENGQPIIGEPGPSLDGGSGIDLSFSVPLSVVVKPIIDYCKESGCTPEDLIDAHKYWSSRMAGINEAIEQQKKNPPVVTTATSELTPFMKARQQLKNGQK